MSTDVSTNETRPCMSNPMNDKAREAFEAWAVSEDAELDISTIRNEQINATAYVKSETFKAWQAWYAALQWAASQQAAEAGHSAEDCDALCPRCNGSGEETTYSDNGPDAHEVTINCRHCDGGGTLYRAYTGVVDDLEKRHKAYMKACGELYFAKHGAAAPAQQAAEGWRPIETAPKDGTEIMLYAPAQTNEGKPVEARVTQGQWSAPSEFPRLKYVDGFAPEPEWDEWEPYWASYDGGFTEEHPPTHWQPLPAAPTAQGDREPFLPGELERMTENGRKAWAGVDPQSLRDGSYQAQGERDA